MRVELPLLPGPDLGRVAPRSLVHARIGETAIELLAVLAGPGTSRAAMIELAHAEGLDPTFPDDVLAEVESLVVRAADGIDRELTDLTALPFVTIDGATSRDLDQALFVEASDAGFVVHYALADASFYAPFGSALFAEAMLRGATYYLPGFSVPMLPRALSEGLVSLNPDGPRRAVVFRHALRRDGTILESRVERARIASRRKLAWGDVQGFYDAPATSPLRDTDFAASLRALREVGLVRSALAEAQGVVRYRREEVSVELGGKGMSFAVMENVRDDVELYNERLSLLTNAEGGRLLRDHPSPAVQPIYRVHPGPDPERLDELAKTLASLAVVHALPPSFVWKRDTPLADYLDALPADAPPGSSLDRVIRAIARQAVMVNLRSSYSTEPSPHVGVGAEPYARFTAPMREVVGVFLHKEAIEMISGVHPPVAQDEALRADVVVAANRARDVQRRVQDRSNELVIDALFQPEVSKPRATRQRFTATVMGLTSGKVHLRLDVPPLDVKLYMADLGAALGGLWLEVVDHGVRLVARGTDRTVLTLGQALSFVVERRDAGRKRWVFRPDLESAREETP